MSVFLSANISSAKHPSSSGVNTNMGTNIIGFADPVLDRLVTAGKSTYDEAERASLYRQVQQELAEQLPYLFLWGAASYDIARSAVRNVDGPLDLAAPNWAWQPERLVVAASNP